MWFLDSKKNSFLSIILDNGLCKYYIRNLGNKNKVLSQKTGFFEFENVDTINEKIMQEIHNIQNKKLFTCILHTDINQYANQKENDKCYTKSVDKDFTVMINKDIIDNYEFKFKVDEHMSALKLLYFLIKNEAFDKTSMFMLKFNKTSVVSFATKDSVFSAYMLNYENMAINLRNAGVEDSEEILCQIIKEQLYNFYQNESCDFVQNIFLYDINSKESNESYYIFKNLSIRTESVPTDILDFLNRINIKENR